MSEVSTPAADDDVARLAEQVAVLADPPRRRLRLNLVLDADDLSKLAYALAAIGNDLELDGREVREITSGGYASGYHLTLTCDPDQTGDRFREQLEAWRLARVEDALADEAVARG